MDIEQLKRLAKEQFCQATASGRRRAALTSLKRIRSEGDQETGHGASKSPRVAPDEGRVVKRA